MRCAALIILSSLLLACGTDDGDTNVDAGADTLTDASSGGDAADTNAADTGGGDFEVPQGAALLDPWLASGAYQAWTSESATHTSTGPHFGGVRTYVNADLLASLDAGGDHPPGAAAVKELYGDGDTVLGYSVLLKVAADSDNGQGFYWYEVYNDRVFADAVGAGACTSCHGSGQDFFRSPFPLQ